MKRSIAILCLAALCLGMLTGCGGNDDPAGETSELGIDGVTGKEDESESALGAHKHTYVDNRCTICQQPMPSEGLEFILNDNEVSYSVFAGSCKSTNVVIPDTYEGLPVTHIGADAFIGHQELTGIYIPDSVTSIGRSAFYHCINLTDVRIGNSVTSIGAHAFRNCRALTSISLPDCLTIIGDQAFDECPDLMETEGGVQYLDTWVFGCDESAGEVVIRSGTKVIKNEAFENCDHLTSVILPDSVTSIGYSAFRSCDGLTSITISDNLTSIGEDAFYYCTALTSIRIPDSLESIGPDAFEGCVSLTYTEYNNGQYLGNEGNPYICLVDVIDPTVAVFSMSAATKFICSDALMHCYRLTDITIPDGVKSIDDYAFSRCDALTNITIPNSVTRIRSSAFESCDNLTEVTISNSVISIGKYAFSSCKSLTSIVYTGTTAEWAAIKKGKDWDSNTPTYTIHCTDGDIVKE